MIPAPTPQEKIVEEALFAPDEFQFAAEHPKHEHVDEQMEEATVEK